MAKTKKNLSELRKAVDSCEPAKRELGIKLLDQLEYMEDLLSEYQKKIKAEGAIIEATNGNGFTVISTHTLTWSVTPCVAKICARWVSYQQIPFANRVCLSVASCEVCIAVDNGQSIA